MLTNFLKINRCNGLCQFQIEYMLSSTKRLQLFQKIKNYFYKDSGFRKLNPHGKVRSDKMNFNSKNEAYCSDVRILSNRCLTTGLSASTMYTTLLNNAKLMSGVKRVLDIETTEESDDIKRQKTEQEQHTETTEEKQLNNEPSNDEDVLKKTEPPKDKPPIDDQQKTKTSEDEQLNDKKQKDDLSEDDQHDKKTSKDELPDNRPPDKTISDHELSEDKQLKDDHIDINDNQIPDIFS